MKLKTKTPTTSKEIVDTIKTLHNEVYNHARMSLDKGIEIGRLLELYIEKFCPHGETGAYLKTVGFSRQTADNYRRLFKNRATLKKPTVGILTLTSAYRLLTDEKRAKSPRKEKATRKEKAEPTVKQMEAEAEAHATEDLVATPEPVQAETPDYKLYFIKANLMLYSSIEVLNVAQYDESYPAEHKTEAQTLAKQTAEKAGKLHDAIQSFLTKLQ